MVPIQRYLAVMHHSERRLPPVLQCPTYFPSKYCGHLRLTIQTIKVQIFQLSHGVNYHNDRDYLVAPGSPHKTQSLNTPIRLLANRYRSVTALLGPPIHETAASPLAPKGPLIDSIVRDLRRDVAAIWVGWFLPVRPRLSVTPYPLAQQNGIIFSAALKLRKNISET